MRTYPHSTVTTERLGRQRRSRSRAIDAFGWTTLFYFSRLLVYQPPIYNCEVSVLHTTVLLTQVFTNCVITAIHQTVYKHLEHGKLSF